MGKRPQRVWNCTDSQPIRFADLEADEFLTYVYGPEACALGDRDQGSFGYLQQYGLKDSPEFRSSGNL